MAQRGRNFVLEILGNGHVTILLVFWREINVHRRADTGPALLPYRSHPCRVLDHVRTLQAPNAKRSERKYRRGHVGLYRGIGGVCVNQLWSVTC